VSRPGAPNPDGPGPWEEDDDELGGAGSRRDVPGDENLDWTAGDDGWGEDSTRWPMTWRGLYPRERWLWFQSLWNDVCALRERYHLAIRSGWWEDDVQLETLAALAAWVDRYDSGEWDDPPGKLALLFDLERIAGLLRDGLDPFDPRRDHPTFLSHIIDLGCQPPPSQ